MNKLKIKSLQLKKLYSNLYNKNINKEYSNTINSIYTPLLCYVFKKRNNLFAHINYTKQNHLTRLILTPHILVKRKFKGHLRGRKSNLQQQQRVLNFLVKFVQKNSLKSNFIFINTENNLNNWFLQNLREKKWYHNIGKIKWIPKRKFN